MCTPQCSFLVLELFWIFPDLVGSFCQNPKSASTWRLLVCWYLWDLWDISQTPSFTSIDCHLSCCTLIVPPIVMAQPNEPAGATAANPLAVLTTALKSLMPNQPVTNFKNTQALNGLHLTNMMISNYFHQSMGSRFQVFRQYHMNQWKRYPPGVYMKCPHYHWPPEVEPIDTCQCDHRWYCSYQKQCENLPGPLSISDGPYCVSKMSNIPIGKCENQAWRGPRWTGRSSESPYW